MPRLIAGGPGKRKIWHAWADGTSLTVRFGKMGTSLQEQIKEFPTPEAAAKELAKLVKQKLAKEYTDNAWTYECDESGLMLREVVDLLPRPDDSSLARELVGLRAGSWSALFWCGDHTFALAKAGSKYTAGLIDRSGAPTWRPFDPPIVGTSFPNGFDTAGERFIVATSDGPAYVIDCKTLARTLVTPAGDEITAAALTRDFAALLRKSSEKELRLELYAHSSGKWTLAKTLPCKRQNVLFPFGGGRGLIVGFESGGDNDWDQASQSWPTVYFLGVDGGVRVLGTGGQSISYSYTIDGRTYYANDGTGLIELCNVDAALAKVARASEPTSLT